MLFRNETAAAADAECVHALHELRLWSQSVKTFDPVHKHIVAYAVVKCSGTLERAFKSMIADRVSRGGSPQVCQCIDQVIRRCSSNPRYTEIVKLLGLVDNEWCNKFKKLVKALPEQDRQALESLVTNRNAVAHGGAVSSGFEDVVGYYCRARRLVSLIEKIF